MKQNILFVQATFAIASKFLYRRFFSILHSVYGFAEKFVNLATWPQNVFIKN